MVRQGLSLALNLLIAVTVAVSWGMMAFQITENGRLSARGLRGMKYFTVLSNLLMGVASAIYCACLPSGRVPHWVGLLKYAGAVSVGLTFLTVMLFLGPKLGYPDMFQGANLWLHLIVPLAAIADFMLLDRQGTFTLPESLIAVIPMALYGLGYLVNLIVNGFGPPERSNDWYGFAARGLPAGGLVFAGMLAGTWLLSLLMRLPRRP